VVSELLTRTKQEKEMKLTSTYQTFRTVGYTFQIPGSDARSTGGVHHHQARKTASGVLVRIVQSNGRFSDSTKGVQATPEQLKMIEAAK
jgi:hypothetical protein